jgi:hypothetical protein
MKAKDFERKFDAGEDVVNYLDLSRARRGSSKLFETLKLERGSVHEISNNFRAK